MNEKVTIENIQKQNSDYNNAVQARNQYESLLLLSRDVFTEYIRFLFELIQNADDAKATEINIVALDNYLVISHDGEAFSKEDVEGICNIGAGTKKSKSNTTGYKGVGFKSVFGKSTCVSIFSNGYQFKFDEVFPQAKYPVMPWQIIPQWTELPKQIAHALKGKVWNVSTVICLDITKDLIADLKELLNTSQILLFLRSIQKISAHGQVEVSIEKKIISSGQVELTKNNSEKSNWIVRNIQDKVDEIIKAKIAPDQNIPDKIKFSPTFDISFAAKVEKGKIVALNERESLIFTYLPTKVKNFGFPFLLNSNFLADTSREKLHEDNAWNQWLMEIAGRKIVDWLAELSTSEFALQILHLLPEQSKSTTNKLTGCFFESFHNYCKAKPFVPNKGNILKTPSEIVIDETGLSNETSFITPKVLIDFINKTSDERKFKSDAFVNPKLQLAEEKLPTLGSVKFDLTNLTDFFTDKIFTDSHELNQNFALIKYFFKKANYNDKWNQKLKSIPFVFKKGKRLCPPEQLMFPVPEGVEIEDDDEVRNTIPEIHKEVYSEIETHSEIRSWLGKLGVKEPDQILDAIADNASSIITSSNYIKLTRYLFSQHNNGMLEGKHHKFSELKIYTTKKEFCSASECYLSNVFEPSLKLQKIEKDLNFVSEKYKEEDDLPSQWKTFFLKIGVIDGINTVETIASVHSNQSYLNEWFSLYPSFDNPYFDGRVFTNYFYKYRFNTITLIERTVKYEFSRLFWNFVISNLKYSPSETVWGYWSSNWGYEYQHATQLNDFIKWLLENKPIIPTTLGTCLKASEVFINEPDIVALAGKYLPVFDSEEVPFGEWKNLLPLKPKLEIENYLFVLSAISNEIQKSEVVTEVSRERIKSIYENLLLKFTRKTEDIIGEWGKTHKLLSSSNKLLHASDLFWLKERNETLISDDIEQVYFPSELEKNKEAERLLKSFGVNIISDFKLIPTHPTPNDSLQNECLAISPYLAAIITKKDGGDFESIFSKLKEAINKVKVNSAALLELAYIYEKDEKVFSRPDSYFEKKSNTVFYIGDWDSPTTMYSLIEHLCEALHIEKYKEELRLLLMLDSPKIADWLKSKFEINKTEIDVKPVIATLISEVNKVRQEQTSPKEIILFPEIKQLNDLLKAKNISYEQLLQLITNIDADEDESIITISSTNHLEQKGKNEENEIARQLVFDRLTKEGFEFREGKGNHSVVNGVWKDGIEYPLVVKSYRNTSYKFNIRPNEWLQLSKQNSMFWIHRGNGILEVLNLEGLLKANSEFHVQFETSTFSFEGLVKFAEVFRFVRNVHFQLDAPNFSMAKAFEEYQFDKRIKDIKEIGGDNQELLH